MEDKRHILRDEQPFDYKLLKDKKAQIFYNNRMIKLIVGKDYDKLLRHIDADDGVPYNFLWPKLPGTLNPGFSASHDEAGTGMLSAL